MKFLIYLPLIFLATGCTTLSVIDTTADPRFLIRDAFNDPKLDHAHWGVKIESLADGEIWYQRNANRMFMPASNQKILTSAAALHVLGPEFRYTTRLWRRGEIEGPVLRGDLIVKGNGDPTFYDRFHDDPRAPFRAWAQRLLELGIRRIDGNIIGDDNSYDDQRYGYGWALNYLDTWYAAESGALQFNENYLDLTFTPPTSLDQDLTITPNVESAYFQIHNKTKLSTEEETRIRISRPFASNEITVSGIVKVGTPSFERSPSIYNPTLFYVTVLKETFEAQGIEVTGKAIDCDDLTSWTFQPKEKDLLISHESPRLAAILKGLMKRSQNMYAETLVRTLAWHRSGLGSYERGRAEVETALAEMGIDPGTYAFMDGSGLTRYDLVSPDQIVTLLKRMRQSDHWETWKDLQPIAGVDGTLKNRMKETAAAGNVRAKTGTISNVRCLSGYVTTADEEELVFSFMLNGHLTSSRSADAITDKVLTLLSEYSEK